MYLLTVSEEDRDKLFKVLDLVLRLSGVTNIKEVVEAYNVLTNVSRLSETSPLEPQEVESENVKSVE